VSDPPSLAALAKKIQVLEAVKPRSDAHVLSLYGKITALERRQNPQKQGH
jgi:hypothetical protein